MRPFVEQQFQAYCGNNWRAEITQALRQDAEPLSSMSGMHLDAHALLTLLRLRRGEVFRGILTFRERNYINELLDMRNRWAHQLRFSADDTFRTLDGIERLLAAVSAPQLADVVHLKDRFREEWLPPPPPPRPPPLPPPPNGEQVQPPKPGSAYRPLFDHLACETAETVTCTFAQIEGIIGRPLPPAARIHNPWWGNDGRGQARAWMAAGRRTCDVDRDRETVTFARE